MDYDGETWELIAVSEPPTKLLPHHSADADMIEIMEIFHYFCHVMKIIDENLYQSNLSIINLFSYVLKEIIERWVT